MKLFLRNYLLLPLITLLTLFSCTEKSTTDSNHPSSAPLLAIDYGISGNFYIALTSTPLELIQKGSFGSQSNFFVSPSLPNGLSLDITNGNIKGTPTNSSRPTPYTITATVDDKTYTKTISLGVAPSIAWVTPVSSNYLKAYVVGDGSKQISDWTWGSSDESLLTVANGLVNPNPTATGGNSAIIYAKKDTSGSANSYSNGISIALADVSIGKTITIGTSIHLIINSGATAITNNQFKSQDLASVVIPNSITNIGNSAFSKNQLTSVVIPNSVTSIGNSAFLENRLTSMVIPNSVTSIGGWAFFNNQLTNLVIPNSVTSIGNNAFLANQLTKVVIADSITNIGNEVFKDNLLTSVVIGSSVTNIGNFAFNNNKLTNVVIPNSVTNIGNQAFGNNQLTNVVIPNSVTNIGNGAFTENPNLVEVSLKQSLYNNIVTTSSTNAVFGTQVTNYIKRP